MWRDHFQSDEKLSNEHSQLAECIQTLPVFRFFASRERTFMIIIYHHLSLTVLLIPDREAPKTG